MSSYVPTIGLEVHVEVKSKSKLFSSSLNAYGKASNTLVNVVDLGYPGTLPVVNKEVIKQGIRACYVLNCSVTKKMHFDRKNYFYPDNPKNYQITQNRTPIGVNGYVEIEVDGVKKKIEIEEIHIEEDTCKSAHRGKVSLLDFNRAGVPLIEIVTKPCIKSGEEAALYLQKLKELLFYANISDCKMEEGSMRCDANVSISKDKNKLGVRTETKNIGSIHSVTEAINYEIKRQEEVLTSGGKICEETRRYDDKEGKTVLMRVKETGNDYRYFIEPDIPYVIVDDNFIDEALSTLPLLPDQLRKKYHNLGISELDTAKLIANFSLNNYFLGLLEYPVNYKMAVNLLLSDISSYLNKHNVKIEETKLDYSKFISVLEELDSNKMSNKNFKDILPTLMETTKDIESIKDEFNIKNITDDNYVREIVKKVIDENASSCQDYKNGHDRALKYLMGMIMKETKGSVNPKLASELLIKELNNID